MPNCCAGCSALRLPGVDDFGHVHKVSRVIQFKCSSTLPTDATTIGTSELSEQEKVNRVPALDWGRSHDSKFCGHCDFCNLVLDALSRRYNADIQSSIQDTGVRAGKTTVSLTLELSQVDFTLFFGHSGEDDNAVKFKGISTVTLAGTLNFTLNFASQGLSTQNVIDIILPFEVFGLPGDADNASTSGVYRRALPPTATSPDNIRKINGWIDECAANHLSCNSLAEGTGIDSNISNMYTTSDGQSLFLPTRLVYVGSPLAGENPRIVLTSEEFKTSSTVAMKSTRYIALSYCWGSAEERSHSLISNTSNIGGWMAAIPWGATPQTFRDVILFAIDMGVRYVWIDSLCILQGDGGDWQEESAQMWSIFSNAFLTVVAAAGSSPHSGFVNRSPSPHCRISLPPDEATEYADETDYCLRHRPGTKWWGTDRMAEITGKRWITRGWTYQEERLARRVLMFGENKFFFDCRERERSEDTDVWLYRPSWSKVIHTGGADGDYENELAPNQNRNSAAAKRKMLQRTFDHWQWLCIQYSHRQLTVAQDKLPAFSGVAAAVASKVKTRYLAGLWESNLPHDLFWDTTGSGAQKSPAYRAPSWSWMSLDSKAITWAGPTTCADRNCKKFCRFLQADVTLVGPNQLGAIIGAFLKLEGIIVHVELVYWPRPGKNKLNWTLLYEGEGIGQGKLDLRDPDPDGGSEDGEEISNVPALLISTCGTGQRATRGLLLERKKEGQDLIDVYRRIGTFFVSAETPFEFRQNLSSWNSKDVKVFILE
jgi:hypothetical protein